MRVCIYSHMFSVHCALARLLSPLLYPIRITKEVLLFATDTTAHTRAAACGIALGCYLVYSKGLSP